jgi:cytochrome c oxidase subunit 2
MDELMAKGESVYQSNCLACHQAGGEGIPAAGFPALKASKIATGPVAGHLDIVLNGGKQNPAMAAYGPQLSDVDLAAVITYERNAFGNDTGDMVQPADVAAAR